MGSFFFPLRNLEQLVLGLIVCLGALSYYTLYPSASNYLTWGPYSANYLDKNRNFNSFRSAVVILRGNRHDKASYDYLDKRVNDFEKVFASFNEQKKYFLTKQNLLSVPPLYKKYEKKIRMLLEQRYTSVTEFKEYLDNQVKGGQIPQETYERAVKYLTLGDRKLAYFDVAAPTIDNFYLRDDTFTGPTGGGHIGRSRPIQNLTYNSFQYYLPDEYLFFMHSNVEINPVIPMGKNHEIAGTAFYGASVGYPSKNIYFHIRSIYNKAHSYPGGSVSGFVDNGQAGVEYFDISIKNMNMNFIRPDPLIRKLLNIYGVDFVSFTRSYLSDKMAPYQNPHVFEDLHSQGFVEFEFPPSYRASIKFGKQYQARVFTNPQSYGRAYIARWVKVIHPEDNLANEGILSLGRSWPRSSKILTKNFDKHMSSVPGDIWRSIIVESSELKDQQEVPRVFEGDNRVDIKKLIASKAVFDVDCQDEQCWFVYNTTVLNGWKAYSDSKELSVHKANLGFIGLKLKKGKQLVWLEYAPPSLVIGLLVTLTGWIFVFWFMSKTKINLCR